MSGRRLFLHEYLQALDATPTDPTTVPVYERTNQASLSRRDEPHAARHHQAKAPASSPPPESHSPRDSANTRPPPSSRTDAAKQLGLQIPHGLQQQLDSTCELCQLMPTAKHYQPLKLAPALSDDPRRNYRGIEGRASVELRWDYGGVSAELWWTASTFEPDCAGQDRHRCPERALS